MFLFSEKAKTIQQFAVRAAFSLALLTPVGHAEGVFDAPIIFVGASFDNGDSPLTDEFVGPIAGLSVEAGKFLSVGAAVVRDPLSSGAILNEARGGSGTFTRLHCTHDECLPGNWPSYETQLEKGLMRSAVRNPLDFTDIQFYTARYVVFGIPNDCLHSDAAGVIQTESQPCETADFNATVDRLLAVGRRAIEAGLTPVFHTYPEFQYYDLSITTSLFNFVWMIDEASYDELREIHQTRIAAELPEAILVTNAWEGFEHIGDGLHPNPATTTRAARAILLAIKQYAWEHDQTQPTPRVEAMLNQDAFAPGDAFRFQFSAYAPDQVGQYDLYAALTFPGGSFVTLGGNGFGLGFPGVITPFQTGVSLDAMRHYAVLETTLGSALANGEYQACAVLTPAGSDPGNAANWTAVHCTPFTVGTGQ